MPKIPEYQQRSQVMGPTAPPGRTSAATSLGVGLQAIANSLEGAGDALLRKQTRDELTATRIKKVQTDHELMTRYQERKQKLSADIDPLSDGYKAFHEDTLRDVEESYSELGNSLSTPSAREYFTQSLAATKEHFYRNATADKSELAKAAAVNAFQGSLNTTGANLLNDPSAFDLAKQDTEAYVNGLVQMGAIDQTVGLELNRRSTEELARSAIKGWIEINPDFAKEMLSTNRWDSALGADGKAQALGELDREFRAREVEDMRRKRLEEEALEQERTQTKHLFVEKAVNGGLSTREILNSNLTPEGKEHYLSLVRRESNASAKNNPAVENAILKRILLPDSDPNKISTQDSLLAEYQKGGIDGAGLKRLMGWLSGKNTIEGRIDNSMKAQIVSMARSKLVQGNPMLGLKDPAGEENFLRFTVALNEEINRGLQEKKTLRQLLDPNSKDYVGGIVNRFVRSPEQIIQDQISSMTPPMEEAPAGPIPKRIPGETVEQYRARMSKEVRK